MSERHVKIAFDSVMKMADHYGDTITEEDGKAEADICEAAYNLMRHFVMFIMTNAKDCDAEKEAVSHMLEALKDALESFDNRWSIESGMFDKDEDRTLN